MRVTTHILPPRDSRGRFVARSAAFPKTRRTRLLPARDGRGRFVASTPVEAPSWYVFSADAYRIPGEPTAPILATAPIASPRRTSRTVRHRFSRAELQSALLVLIIIVVSGCYALHLTAARP